MGLVDPLPIAMSTFVGSSEVRAPAGADIAGVTANNLGHSGYFRPLPPESFIGQSSNFDQEPRLGDWRQIQAKALVTGQTVMDGGRLKAQFILWDVGSQQKLAGFEFATSPKNWRRLAHLISDKIYQTMTGIPGYFDTRIVFVSETGPKDKRVKKLSIMDQDGANVRSLSDGNQIVLTPRFSPDGQRVIMSLQDEGNSNIFVLDLRSRQTQQLTNVPAINTAPSFSADGSQIVFESDREGTQQIYLMNADGSNQRRISFGNGRYATPVWSPDGRYIAFTKTSGGRFDIGVMNPDGSGERILTEGFHNEGPTWAPNSRVIMFFRDEPGDSGGPRLYSVDVSGYNEQLVKTPSFASDPAWSPLLN